jgi:rhamnogalacturonyl hydrolase YesR
MQNLLVRIAVAVSVLIAPVAAQNAGMDPAEPLKIARVLAARYPAQPIMSYIPALSWSGSIRLSGMTNEAEWREKAMKDMQAFLSGQTPAIAEPHRLTSLAGALAFFDAAALAKRDDAGALAQRVAAFISDAPAGTYRLATHWTDDMFMVSSVISRAGNAGWSSGLSTMLSSYAEKLQRPDGLFIHAVDGPHAWGRGNGFALLGVTEALTRAPSQADNRRLLDIYRTHVAALAKHQSDDGSWRQVIDEPASYRELTATAMIVAAMSRGVARGWIDRATYQPVIDRGWKAVAARVMPDGTVRDVCSGTGAGPTKEYYLNRPVVNGADDRGGAMALLAAIEVEELRRRR